MTTRFADAAGRLAGIAGAIAGWRPDEFWRATPAELGAVIQAIDGDPEPCAATIDLKRLQEMFPDG